MPATRQHLFARLDELGIASTTIEHEAVFTVAESSQARARATRRAHQEPVPQGQEGSPLPCRGAGQRTYRPQDLAQTAGLGPPELRQAGAADGGAGSAGGLGDAVRPHQRQRAARDGDIGCRYDAPRAAQLPSAGEHGDDQHRARRSPTVHPLLRPRATYHGRGGDRGSARADTGACPRRAWRGPWCLA